MVELALHPHIDAIRCEHLPGGTTRVHLAMHHTAQDIAYEVGDQLTDDQLADAQSLYSENTRNRKFRYEGGYLVVSSA